MSAGHLDKAVHQHAGGQLIPSFRSETSAREPLAVAAFAAVLIPVAVIACWLPARRATNGEAIWALRSE